jgi:Holliday junction resolvase
MTNLARKGANAERELRKLLESDGWLVMRSAASKGPFDLAAFGISGVRLIQVKSGVQAGRKEIKLLQAIACGLPRYVTVELWVRQGPKKWSVRLVTCP